MWVQESSTFTYPSDEQSSGDLGGYNLSRNSNEELMWDVEYQQFEFNGSITSEVKMDGNQVGSDDDLLAVFSQDGECRGVARANQSPFEEGKYVFLVMAYSNEVSGEDLSFSYYDATNDVIYENIQTIKFEGDMVTGDAIDSYVVNVFSEGFNPIEYNLRAAYPNPFNPSTNIKFSIANSGYTSISIYDLQGRFIDELVNGFKSAGDYEVVWNANNASSGVYFIHMNVNGFTSSQKVMLIK